MTSPRKPPGRPTTPTDPDLIAWAVGEMAKGRGSREVAKEASAMGYPVAHMTVVRWHKKAQEGQATPAKPASAAPPNPLATALAEKRAKAEAQAAAQPPAPTPITEEELDQVLGEVLANARTMFTNARGVNDAHAQKALAQITAIADLQRKREAKREQAAGMISFSREELNAAASSLVERVINPLRARAGLPPLGTEDLI